MKTTTVVPVASGNTRTVLTTGSAISTAVALETWKSRRKTVISFWNVSPVLAAPCSAPDGLAPTVRSSMTVSGLARTTTDGVGCGGGVDTTRTSAGIGSAAHASRQPRSTAPKTATTPPRAPGRAVVAAVLYHSMPHPCQGSKSADDPNSAY